MNLTALNHPNTQARLFAAMKWAVQASYGIGSANVRSHKHFDIYPADDMVCVFIKNKHNRDFLSITYRRNGEKQGFRFYDKHGDVTALVLKSLRSL